MRKIILCALNLRIIVEPSGCFTIYELNLVGNNKRTLFKTQSAQNFTFQHTVETKILVPQFDKFTRQKFVV